MNLVPKSSIKSRAFALLERRKYEALLIALLQHLFAASVLTDLEFYARVVWPINMALLGILSIGVFAGSSARRLALKNVMTLVVVVLPAAPALLGPLPQVMVTLSLCYVAFFLATFAQVMRHLLRPNYINLDIVSAAICGFFLLLETSVFLMQALYYGLPHALRGLDTSSFTTVYLDLVYFCSIVLTTIGFGDITPAHHITKLATAMIGISGQMYSVVLIGLLISRYSSAVRPLPTRP